MTSPAVRPRGLHHITLACADAQRTVDFYTGTLGLRLVKQTVNFDDPGSYHLYFGDATGSLITFFEWKGVPAGKPGIGGTHHFALTVPDRDALLRWKRWLTGRGVSVSGPLDRHYFESIYLRDPDGAIIELATRGPGWTRDEAPDSIGTTYREPPPEMVVTNRDRARIDADTWSEPVDAIAPDMRLSAGMHHVTAIGADIARSHSFYADLLGMRLVKRTSNFDDPKSAHWYWGVGDGRPGTLVTYFERDPQVEPRARIGTGQTHHFALGVPTEEAQLELRERLLEHGLPASPVMDRQYFRSVYSRDPDGHIVEIATDGPGFMVDEPEQTLGTRLMLPPWLEPQRPEIESSLTPLRPPAWPAEAVPA